MTLSRVVFSHAHDDWETPANLFSALHAEFGFGVDVAATVHNRKVHGYFGPDHRNCRLRDALQIASWNVGRPCWMNPPYSCGQQARFIAKATDEALQGCTVVALLPARTDTKAFHAYVWDASAHRPRPWVHEVRFLAGRLRFVGGQAGAPFPSMVVVFSPPKWGDIETRRRELCE